MGKAITFFGFVWLLACMAGSVLVGQVAGASTHLTADLTAAGTTITVATTNGFPEPGVLIIGGERIGYASRGATTFTGNLASPMVRGAGGTTAVAHVTGEAVRTVESSLINNAVDYNVAVLADATGSLAFIQMPLAVFSLIKTFVAAPFGFLGTDLAIITLVWGVAMAGLLVSITIAMVGGRRV